MFSVITQKEDQKLVFKTDYHLMQVKSIAECSKRAFCNTFDLHKATSPVENQNDLELDFKVFFFVDSCCSGIVLDESN